MQIRVRTPSRLHFGLIDLNGELGRINGSLGIAIEKPGWEIIAGKNIEPIIKCDLDDEYINLIQEIKNRFDKRFSTDSSEIKFQINKMIPAHVGLGSKTQFLLGISTLLTHLNNQNVFLPGIAEFVKRGGTSGIGVGAFESGGFMLDGGHSFGKGKATTSFLPSSKSRASPPPILLRHYPPKEWRFLVITPRKLQGSFGKEEIELFRQSCPIDSSIVEKLSRLILMKILPSLVEGNLKVFGEGLTEIQSKFEKFGFEKYQGTIVEEILSFVKKQKQIAGYGISSFGPTVFALVKDQAISDIIIKKIKTNFNKDDFKLLLSSKVNTRGAKIDYTKKE